MSDKPQFFYVTYIRTTAEKLWRALIEPEFTKQYWAGTWQESHFSWRIRSVLWAGLLYVLTSWLWLLFLLPGWIAWGLISLWFLYRIVKGMVRMNAGRSMETSNVV